MSVARAVGVEEGDSAGGVPASGLAGGVPAGGLAGGVPVGGLVLATSSLLPLGRGRAGVGDMER